MCGNLLWQFMLYLDYPSVVSPSLLNKCTHLKILSTLNVIFFITEFLRSHNYNLKMQRLRGQILHSLMPVESQWSYSGFCIHVKETIV